MGHYENIHLHALEKQPHRNLRNGKKTVRKSLPQKRQGKTFGVQIMTALAQKFADEALLLPREERAELVEKLLQSLNVPTQKEIDRLWEKEAEKRVREYEEGKIKAIGGEQVFKEIKDRLGR
jgi:putative addiction module component (TIGR02574 family)